MSPEFNSYRAVDPYYAALAHEHEAGFIRSGTTEEQSGKALTLLGFLGIIVGFELIVFCLASLSQWLA